VRKIEGRRLGGEWRGSVHRRPRNQSEASAGRRKFGERFHRPGNFSGEEKKGGAGEVTRLLIAGRFCGEEARVWQEEDRTTRTSTV
jgi:hypothetical protein